jgi:ferredoxin
VELEDDCHLGIVVPVAMQSTFPIVWEFIERLPEGNMRQVFMADTMESFSGGIVGPMKKSLESKGYRCIGACEFRMASSMQITEKKAEIGRKKNEIALLKVEEYVQSLINESAKWKQILVLSDAMKSISKGRSIWTKTSKRIRIDSTLCIKCRMCEKYCPVKAIQLSDHNMKIDHNLCVACMRCVNYCPKNAFTLGEKRVIQKKVVKINEL